jgi:hypothetical protein
MFKDDARLDESAVETREVSRRTIAKGVAWTVPAIIVATAAPAAAASAPTVFVNATGQWNGKSGNVTFTLFFTGSSTSKVTITSVTSSSGAWTKWPATEQDLTTSGTQLQLSFIAKAESTSATNVIIKFKIDGGSEQSANVKLPDAPA